MSEKIEPALTAEEWAAIGNEPLPLWPDMEHLFVMGERPEAVIAYLNNRLPDDDPRKITRGDVRWLRGAASYLGHDSTRGEEWRARLNSLAAKLASLLPPEG